MKFKCREYGNVSDKYNIKCSRCGKIIDHTTIVRFDNLNNKQEEK